MQEGRVIPERLSITVRPPDIPSERRYPPSFRTARTLRMSAIRLIDGDLASNAKEPHPFDDLGVDADRQTLSPEDFAKVMDLLKFRPMQVCILLKTLEGAEEMQRMMVEAIKV